MNSLVKLKELFPEIDIPSFMFSLEQKYIDKNTNGCGDKWTAYLVPDDILGMNGTPACDIHDLDYTRIINLWFSYPDITYFTNIESEGYAKKVKECKDIMIEANLRLKYNFTVLAKDKLKEDLKSGVWSIFFWKSEKWQARKRYKERLKIINWFYKGVEFGGWSSLERSFSKK